MASAEIVSLHTAPADLLNIYCTNCYAAATAACGCGCGYMNEKTMTARRKKRIRAVATAHPDWTQAQIAAVPELKELRVTQQRVAEALKGFKLPGAGKSKKRAKTATNPKGAGRKSGSKSDKPKRSARKTSTPVLDRARDIVRPMVAEGIAIRSRKLAEEHAISHVQFETAVAIERALLAAAEPVDDSHLPVEERRRVNEAISQARERLEAEIEGRVRAEIKRSFMNGISDECSIDERTPQSRWAGHLKVLALNAIELEEHWDKEYPGWREFTAAPELKKAVDQAATIWREIANHLQRRKAA